MLYCLSCVSPPCTTFANIQARDCAFKLDYINSKIMVEMDFDETLIKYFARVNCKNRAVQFVEHKYMPFVYMTTRWNSDNCLPDFVNYGQSIHFLNENINSPKSFIKKWQQLNLKNKRKNDIITLTLWTRDAHPLNVTFRVEWLVLKSCVYLSAD